MKFAKQRAGVKTWLGLFQCVNVWIGGKIWHDISNGCKNIYYCALQDPDFQVREEAMEARQVKKRIAKWLRWRKHMASQRGNNSQFGEEKLGVHKNT